MPFHSGPESLLIRRARRAIEMDPNDPGGYEAMAWALIHAGKSAESLEFIERAERLDPQSNYLYRLGEAQFHLEQYERSTESMVKYSRSHPDDSLLFLYLASAYGYLDRKQEASAAYERYKEVRVNLGGNPATNALDQVSSLFLSRGGEEEKRVREGLRKAGFDIQPEVVEATPQGITLERPADSAVRRVYEAARVHCREHGKSSAIMSTMDRTYVFSCR